MDECGRVIILEGDFAQVRMQRTAACEQCGMCGISTLNHVEPVIVRARNDIRAGVGDWVRVQIKPQQFLSAVSVVFLLPLGGAFLGYVVASFLAARLGLRSVLTGVAGLLVGFWLSYQRIKAVDRALRSNEDAAARIVEVVTTQDFKGALHD